MSVQNGERLATKQDLADMYQEILPYLGGSADAGFTPVGSVIAIMGVTAPANYLACNGQIVNVADYPELANYFEQQFGTKYKFGGSGTTFGIPDLRGEFLRGTGTNSHTNQGSGADVGAHQDATSIPSYGVNSSGELMAVPYSNTDNYVLNQDGAYNSGTNLNKARTATMKTAWDVSGMRNRDNVRPTNTSVLFCVATKNIYLNPALDYSTDEKVVGKWIDGKTLYQKTFTGVLPTTSTDGVSVTGNITGVLGLANVIDKLVSIQGSIIDTTNTNMGNLFTTEVTPTYVGTTGAYYSKTSDTIRAYNSIARYSGRTVYTTIQYTKTT